MFGRSTERRYVNEMNKGRKQWRKGKKTNNSKLIEKSQRHFDRADAIGKRLGAPQQNTKNTTISPTININKQNQILSNNHTRVRINRKK